jgi:predicted outer membrane repeat protein
MYRQRERVGTSLCGPVVALCLITLGLWGSSQAAEFACGAGDVACLIAAINTANTNGQANTIILEAGTYTLTAVDNTISGPNGLPSIRNTLTIHGAGADATIVERAASAPAFRLLHIEVAGTLALEGLTLTGGSVGSGGGDILASGGSVALTRSTLVYNSTSAGSGGGIYANGGPVTLTNVTFAYNSSGGVGGGIHANGGPVTLTNVTFAYNSAGGSGGGSFFSSGTSFFSQGPVTLTNVTFAYNSVGGSGGGILVLNTPVTLTNVTLGFFAQPPEKVYFGNIPST